MKSFDEPKASFLSSLEDEDRHSADEQNNENNACGGGITNDSRSRPVTAAVVVVREGSGDRTVYLSARSAREGFCWSQWEIRQEFLRLRVLLCHSRDDFRQAFLVGGIKL